MNNKKELLNKLKKLNEHLEYKDISLSLVIVGGSFFILNDIVDRATTDIDVLNNIDENLKIIFNKLNINNKVRGVFEATFGDWDDDLNPYQEVKYSNLRILFPSTERMLVQKIFLNKRWDDFESAFLSNELDFNKFMKILKEIRNYSDPIFLKSLNENWDDFIQLVKRKKLNHMINELTKIKDGE